MARLGIRSKAAEPPSATKTTFPLPRELRDQILGYLLYHDNVKGPPVRCRPKRHQSGLSIATGRNKSLAHTYHYHPSILGVNKQMRAEGKEILASNHFVVITLEWDMLDIAIHWHDLPIVSQHAKSIAKFQHHCMRVKLQNPMSERHANPKWNIIVLASDLPRLCSLVVPWSFARTPSLSPFYFDTPTGTVKSIQALSPALKDNCILQTSIHMITTKARPMTSSLEEELLAPFHAMIVGRQNVSFLNTTRTAQTTALQARMGPNYISGLAALWQLIDIARQIKESIDKLVSEHDLDLAMAKYHWLGAMISDQRVLALPSSEYDGGSAQAATLLLRIALDAYTTATFLQLRSGDIDAAWQLEKDAQQIWARIPKLPLTETVGQVHERYLPCRQAVAWLHHLCTFVTKRDAMALPRMLRELREITQDAEPATLFHYMLQWNIEHIDFVAENCELASYDGPSSVGVPDKSILAFLKLDRFPPFVFHTEAPAEWSKPEGCDGLVLDRHREFTGKLVLQL
ncbi:hypothetical protein LTR62_003268 [Meristemomyces frigidus]|uniref:Uncharacterized protein n=1 Tax=Meristemomyces frigidus TaxID=1508187 RepID=A0AAN7TF58_9PEZI|nr:hypothetical protein LTR62_003268 [Meristemomyces frigidus]